MATREQGEPARCRAGAAHLPPGERSGDTIAIPGDYQYRALHTGNAVQRFWHLNKQLTIARYLPPAPGQMLVNVGCGSGVIADFLAESGADVLGIDGSEAAVAFARRTFKRDNLRFEQGLVDRTFESPRPASAIFCLEVIEHVYPAQALEMLRIFHRCLEPGGRVYVTTPNSRSAWPLIEWLLDTLRLAPRLAGDQHVAAYSRRTLAELIETAGFTVEHLVTTSLFAPWLAPVSGTLARAMNHVETGSPFGCILVCVARKAA